MTTLLNRKLLRVAILCSLAEAALATTAPMNPAAALNVGGLGGGHGLGVGIGASVGNGIGIEPCHDGRQHRRECGSRRFGRQCV